MITITLEKKNVFNNRNKNVVQFLYIKKLEIKVIKIKLKKK
jgi:hypothetical protein